ncbi:MAG: tail fiber domain-containing protein [Limisphaerales bacterium]
MKTKTKHLLARAALVLALSSLNLEFSTAFAQGTAFTYQGQLQNNGSPASGTYNLTFSLFNINAGGSAVAGPVTTNGVAVSNGLFTVTIDFGAGVFNGTNYWLQIGVETNGGGGFTTLTPRQQLTPAPYSIFANTSSNLSGTLPAAQLGAGTAAINISGSAASFSGSLNGDVTGTQSATVVSKVGGVTAANVASGANAANGAASANTANAIVKRDGNGNFSAGSLTLAGNLNLPATTAAAGIIYSGTNTLVHAYGPFNVFVGAGAGNFIMAAGFNTGLGVQALAVNYGGSYNTAVGFRALYNNTNGLNNTAVGGYALASNTNGSDNTASGNLALAANTSGADNTADGAQALWSNTSGNNNLADGVSALAGNLTGSGNTASGAYALSGNSAANDNTADGFDALSLNANGSNNVASGAMALYNNTNGFNNAAAGYQALYNNTSGYANTANGGFALYDNTSGYANTANGFNALYSNTNGYWNVANGYQALFYNTSGQVNTGDGAFALFHNTTGSQNTANGFEALYGNDTGSDNTASGYFTLYANTSGSYNEAGGYEALTFNTSGGDNTALGAQSMYYNTNGGDNTAVGFQALAQNTNGSGNVALGYQAGLNVNGNNNIEIGDPGNAADNGTIRIGVQGFQGNTFIAGISGVTVSGSPVVVNGSGQLGVAPSSQRFKQDIHSMGDASDVLLSLRPVTFRYKPEIDPKGAPQFGLVAEEVAKADPDLVVHDDQSRIFTVRYEAVNAMLLNEFLKEHGTVEKQDTEIQHLKQQNETLEKRLDYLENAVKSITARN